MRDTTVADRDDGAQGVAYAGYQEPVDEGTSDVWIGRATVSAPARAWASRYTALTYIWTKYDMATQQVIHTGGPAPVATVGEVVAYAGDGAGFYTIGFGCDGARFSMDAWRIGSAGNVTSYDLEGLTTTTEIVGSRHRVEPGEEVTLTGRVRLGIGDRLRKAP